MPAESIDAAPLPIFRRGWLVATVAVWPLVGAFYVHLLTLDRRHLGLQQPGMAVLVLWIEWGVLTPAIVRLAAARLPFGDGAARAWRTHLGALAAGVVGLFVVNNVVGALVTGSRTFGANLSSMMLRFTVAGAYGASLYFATASMVWFVVMEEQAKQRQLRVARLTAAVAAEELATLRVRLRPELVVGTLRSIAGCSVARPDVAEESIHLLSDLLRDALGRSRGGEVPLADALDSFESYVRLIALTAGQPLLIDRRLDPSAAAASLPARLLQLATDGIEVDGPLWLSSLALATHDALHVTAVLRGCSVRTAAASLPAIAGTVVSRSETNGTMVVKVVRTLHVADAQ